MSPLALAGGGATRLRGVVRPARGLVPAFGAGALISAVSFDLAEEGARVGDPGFTSAGLLGAVTYFVLARLVDRRCSGPGRGSERAPSQGQ